MNQCDECGKETHEPFDDYCEDCTREDMGMIYSPKTGGYEKLTQKAKKVEK